MRSNPEICLQRINLRNRPEEKDSISLEYLNQLHHFHDKWLIDKDGADKRTKIKEVIVIDASHDLKKMYSTYDNLTEQLFVDKDKLLKT